MEDKRITKTKRALKSALLKLLTTQAFDVISITELCKIANVSRITFYTHYKDKFAQSLNTDGTMQVVFVNLIDKD